ncbi:MAG TPA: type IV pilin protein [Gemmatimonadaceae bacterium]|nr:type IV pilin protein [Gemmatimonadaceae bacterium]
MDWIVPFRWARSRQPRNHEPLRFAAGACPCALPHRARLVSILAARPAGSPTFAVYGFTLIELLTVIAIVAILAAIALPSYQAQIRKGNRAAAQSYLMDLAQREAQHLLDARAYASAEAALGYTATPADVASHYTIGIAAPVVAPPAFTITATAIGAQVADGNLTIDNQGTKTPSGKW